VIRYRLRLECEAGFGTREEWSRKHYDTLEAAKEARDKANAEGGQSAAIVVLWPGDWHYDRAGDYPRRR
jgi:hypothetical protein